MKKARSGHSELSPCAHHEAPADAGIGRLPSCDFRAADFCLSGAKHISYCICTEISMESILRRAQDKVRKILRELCKWKGAPIIEAEVCRDHIHTLAEKPPAKPAVFYFQYGCQTECRENTPRHSPKSTVCCGTKSLPSELRHPSVVGTNCGAKRKTVAKISRFKQAYPPFGRRRFCSVHYFKTLANLSKRFAFFTLQSKLPVRRFSAHN